MPFYRYQCENCCEEFSKRRRMSERDEPAECPNCGSETTKRLISSVNSGRASSGGSGG